MKIRFALLALGLLLTACTEEYDCNPVRLSPVFVGYPLTDLNPLILRRYPAHDNFRTLLDSVVVANGRNGSYRTAFDTVFVDVISPLLQEGNDWQVYMPAVGRTVRLTDIGTDKKTGKQTHGIFSLEKAQPCFNELLSATLDGQSIPFKSGPFGKDGRFYIRK